MEALMTQQPSKEQLSPTSDRIIVEPLEDPGVGPSGLTIVSNSGSSGEQYGRVLAVGPGTYQNGVLIQPNVQVGDIVMFQGNRGVKVRLRSEDVLFMTERDFLAVIKPE